MHEIVIGTAGHIDHGKSALVKALTGTDPDRLKEERERGITTDLGFAHAVIGGLSVGFVDVPGHERFVRHMLAGAGGLDAVLLAIAANESVMPQTREHFAICRLLGIPRGLVVLTKADLVDDETLALVALEARELVANSFLEDAPILPVSARTGAGLDVLRETLAALPDAARAPRGGPARLPIDRVFTVRGFGTVATGTLVSGRVAVDDELEVAPVGGRVRVRGLHVHNVAVESADAPCRLAVNVGSSDVPGGLARGLTLTAPGALAATRRVDARLEVLVGGPPLRHGARVRVHQGTSDLPARVAIAATRTGPTAAWVAAAVGERAVVVPPDGEAFVRLRLDAPAALTRGDRFVLRASSPAVTLGGGRVLDPQPPAAGLRRATSLGRFLVIDGPAFVDRWVADAGEAGLDGAALARRGGLPPDEARQRLQAFVRDGGVRVEARVVAAAALAQLESRIGAELAQAHAADPSSEGVPREALRERTARRAPEEVFDAALDRLAAAGVAAGRDRIALTAHRPRVSDEERTAYNRLDARLRAAGLAPPDAATLARELGISAASVDAALRRLARDRRLVMSGGLPFHIEALASLKAALDGLKQGAAPVRLDVAAFKTRFGVSRKHAIPLLEYLDRERVTRRIGNEREVL